MFVNCLSYDYYGSRRNGGFTEYLDVKSWNLIKIPEEVEIDDAAFMEPLAVVLHALKKGNLLSKKNISLHKDRMAILGAGFLGLLALITLRLYHPKMKIYI